MKNFTTSLLFIFFSLSCLKKKPTEVVNKLSEEEEIGFALTTGSFEWLAPIATSEAGIVSGSIVGVGIVGGLVELASSKDIPEKENKIKNSPIYRNYSRYLQKVDEIDLQEAKRSDFSEIKKILKERALKGEPGKLNIFMLKIELGGGHKAALKAMEDSILWGLSDEEKKLINIVPIDFFGSNKEAAAREFNKILETENADKLSKNLGGKPMLERFFDTNVGRSIIGRNISHDINIFAKKAGISPKSLKPDLVVSAQPFGLHALNRFVTDNYNTQLRVVPTDFYLGDWMQRFGPISSDDPTIRYDASYDVDYIRSQFSAKGIDAIEFFGYPVRKEISEMAKELFSEDDIIKARAEKNVSATISNLSKSPDGKPSFKSGDETALIMMGSKGTSAERYIDYIRSLAEFSKNIDQGKTLHVFVAAIEPRPPKGDEKISGTKAYKKYKEYYDRQILVFDKVNTAIEDILKNNPNSKIKIHLKSFMNAREVGSLIYHGPTITKAGGSTAAEIAALGGRALFNMRISEVAPWEKGNAEFLDSKGYAIRMSTDKALEGEFLKKGMGQFLKQGKNKPLGINDFQSEWGTAVISDLKRILRFK